METNDPNPQQEEKPQQQVRIAPTRHPLTWILVAIILLLLAGSVYLWMQLASSKKDTDNLNKEKQQLQSQLNAKNDDSDDQGDKKQVACTYTPSADFKANIKAALDSKNTAAFSTYTTNPVKYVLAASEMGGNVTPDQAATNLEYTHSATGPWDFNLPQATTDGYDAGFYTDYFGDNTLVGKSASGMVVAFEFSCDGSKISEIFVAASEDLLQD